MSWERFKILVQLLCNLMCADGGTPTVRRLHGLMFHIEFNARLSRAASLSGTHFFRQDDGPASLALERALYELENDGAIRRRPLRLFNSDRSDATHATSDYGIEALRAAPQDVFRRDELRLTKRSLNEYRALLDQFDLELHDLLPAADVETGRRIDLQTACALPASACLAADIAHATALNRLKRMQAGGGAATPHLRTIIEEHPATRTIDAAARINAATRTVYEMLLQRLTTLPTLPGGLELEGTPAVTDRRCISGNGGSERLPLLRLTFRMTSELIVVEDVEVALPVTDRPAGTGAALNGAAARADSARVLNGAAA